MTYGIRRRGSSVLAGTRNITRGGARVGPWVVRAPAAWEGTSFWCASIFTRVGREALGSASWLF
ncbi:uncharacterized protein EI90DRAFT_3048471 [Cantharellus anzutake]|uniref:uncharacterized protein n=1 Tax=Cantharellus anzutake TaxID=1750568 RepID=UPI0019069149|nr:uncharacterized protein EI90DRAFT_3048471 [Cantharellus anzutake]KAF8335468.1 hypothetical protein EI90DRAFT_3048471 [Cantharellus anzutake]